MSATGRSDTELLDLAHAYALDALPERERRALERRRRRADRYTAAEFDSTVTAVHETLAELSVVDACTPPPELEAGLLKALDRAIRAAGRKQVGFGSVPRLAQAAAAILLLVVLGTGLLAITQRIGGHESSQVTAAVVAAQPDTVTRTTPVGGGGQLRVETSQSLGAASVAFENLADPPPGHAYQVWLVPLGQNPHSAAVLGSVPGNPVITKFGPTDTLAVTVEPSGGSDQPTTTPIASVNLY